jgi:hypothetical protein
MDFLYIAGLLIAWGLMAGMAWGLSRLGANLS